MNIAALHGAGSNYGFITTGRVLPTVVDRDTTSAAATNADAPATAQPQPTDGPSHPTLRSSAQPQGASTKPAAQRSDTPSTFTPAASTSKSSVSTAASASDVGTPTPQQSTTDRVGSANSSLITDLKRYATAATQGDSQAYQEYAKAWGGRVVHGEVELPPFSIYAE